MKDLNKDKLTLKNTVHLCQIKNVILKYLKFVLNFNSTTYPPKDLNKKVAFMTIENIS